MCIRDSYILHSEQSAEFRCGPTVIVEKDTGEPNIEAGANQFASHLLMQANQFRPRIETSPITLDLLSELAQFYGVSFEAMYLSLIHICPGQYLQDTLAGKKQNGAGTDRASFAGGLCRRRAGSLDSSAWGSRGKPDLDAFQAHADGFREFDCLGLVERVLRCDRSPRCTAPAGEPTDEHEHTR